MQRYRWVARTWAVVFVATGLQFLVVPDALARALTALAHGLGLSGDITLPSGNLGWVLTLSLMACITALALESARAPAEAGSYRALLTAKATSTLAFAGLALVQAPAWWLCAFADGFVAATLVWARRPAAQAPARTGGEHARSDVA